MELEHAIAWLHMTQATVEWRGLERVHVSCWVASPGWEIRFLAVGDGSSFREAVNKCQSDYAKLRGV